MADGSLSLWNLSNPWISDYYGTVNYTKCSNELIKLLNALPPTYTTLSEQFEKNNDELDFNKKQLNKLDLTSKFKQNLSNTKNGFNKSNQNFNMSHRDQIISIKLLTQVEGNFQLVACDRNGNLSVWLVIIYNIWMMKNLTNCLTGSQIDFNLRPGGNAQLIKLAFIECAKFILNEVSLVLF